MKELREYIIKFIELKYNPNHDYHHKSWGFGHDWNSMFPKEIDIEMPVRDAVYMALCVMFEYKPSLNDDGKDWRIQDIITWLKKDKLTTPPHLIPTPLKNGAWIIYYLLLIPQIPNKK